MWLFFFCRTSAAVSPGDTAAALIVEEYDDRHHQRSNLFHSRPHRYRHRCSLFQKMEISKQEIHQCKEGDSHETCKCSGLVYVRQTFILGKSNRKQILQVLVMFQWLITIGNRIPFSSLQLLIINISHNSFLSENLKRRW